MQDCGDRIHWIVDFLGPSAAYSVGDPESDYMADEDIGIGWELTFV